MLSCVIISAGPHVIVLALLYSQPSHREILLAFRCNIVTIVSFHRIVRSEDYDNEGAAEAVGKLPFRSIVEPRRASISSASSLQKNFISDAPDA